MSPNHQDSLRVAREISSTRMMGLRAWPTRWYVTPPSSLSLIFNTRQSTDSSFASFAELGSAGDTEEDLGDESVTLRFPQDHSSDFIDWEGGSEGLAYAMVCNILLVFLDVQHPTVDRLFFCGAELSRWHRRGFR